MNGPARPTRQRCQSCSHWQASADIIPSDRRHYKMCIIKLIPTMADDGCTRHKAIYRVGGKGVTR